MQIALHDLRKKIPLLRSAAARGNRAAAQKHGRQERLRDCAPAEFLHHDSDVDRTSAKAAVFLGESKAEPTQLGEIAPMLRTETLRLLRGLPAAFGIVVLGHVTRDTLAQHPLRVGGGQIHVDVIQRKRSENEARRRSDTVTCARAANVRPSCQGGTKAAVATQDEMLQWSGSATGLSMRDAAPAWSVGHGTPRDLLLGVPHPLKQECQALPAIFAQALVFSIVSSNRVGRREYDPPSFHIWNAGIRARCAFS